MMRALLILNFLLASSSLLAEGYFLRLGPTSLGNGGANPLGIPPGATDVEVSLITNGGFESNLGLPGLLFGYRARKNWGGYISFGGGLVVDANGGGPGTYTAFGWDFGGKAFKGNFEFKQAFGVGEYGTLNPYAVRFGIGYWNH